MTFYNPDELSSYGQDIEQLRQAQNDRLLSRPPAPPAQGGSGLAQALIQQLNSQQGASPPSSLGEALQRALQVAGQTMQAYGQHQAGIDPNRNNPETLRNRLLQKAVEEQLMQERMLTTQGQQIQANQALEGTRNTNRIGLEGVRHGNAMELNATPKAIPPELSANLRSQTTSRDTLLPHQVGKMTAQEEEALAKTRYLEGANNDQPGGSIINPTSIPADAQPLADINPVTGAVTPAPGQTIAPRELRSLQDALGGGGTRPTFPPPKRVRKSDTINGPTFSYEKSPEELAYNAGLKTQATEARKALPEAAAGKVAEFEAIDRNANDIRALAQEHPEFLGLERSATAGMREKLGNETISPLESTFNGKINLIYAQLVRALQGARASDKDIENFGKNIFPSSAIRDPAVFQARIDSALEYVRGYESRYQELLTTPRGQIPAAQGGATQQPTTGGGLSPHAREILKARGYNLPGE